jgi:hypothetical protein
MIKCENEMRLFDEIFVRIFNYCDIVTLLNCRNIVFDIDDLIESKMLLCLNTIMYFESTKKIYYWNSHYRYEMNIKGSSMIFYSFNRLLDFLIEYN